MPFHAVLLSRRTLGALAVSLALVVGLSACGSSSSSATAAASASGSAGGTSGAQYQARLNLAKCFRSHGLNVPDPTSGTGGGGVFRSLRDYPQAKVQAAMQACRSYFSQAFTRPNLTPAQRQQAQQRLVKFAQCMRSHGVNIPDPTPGGAGGGFGFARQFGSVDRNSPAFQAASKACASLRPRFGRGGGGGPGGPGGPGAPAGGGAPGA